LRADHEGTADGEHLLLAAGEGAGFLGAPLAEDGEEGVAAVDIGFELARIFVGNRRGGDFLRREVRRLGGFGAWEIPNCTIYARAGY